MSFFDLRTPFFRPLWVRILVTALALGWAGVELVTGSVFWTILFGAVGLYCFYEFFIAFDPENFRAEEEEE
ncbi:hypothetical protein [Albidovulum aquaemixtae]|nr:hypothetical protein [Defluviimonas aquaemixtae]